MSDYSYIPEGSVGLPCKLDIDREAEEKLIARFVSDGRATVLRGKRLRVKALYLRVHKRGPQIGRRK